MIRAMKIFIATALMILPITIFAQDPGPKIDYSPLGKPEPLVVMTSDDPSGILAGVRQVLINAGYAIVKSDRTTIDAQKADGPDSKDYDRVIVWLERNFERPMEDLELYLAYGRYEEIWGSTREVFRVQIDSSEETERTADLRTKIVQLSQP